jgi:hypothetical protein
MQADMARRPLRNPIGAYLAAAALLLAPAAPASAQTLAPSAPVPAAEASAPAAPDCAALAAERTELQARHAEVKATITDLAFGRPHRRRHVGAGDVGRAAAGTAAAFLLPFGIGLIVNAGTTAAAKAGKRKRKAAPEPEPDVPALIDRQHAIEERLAELAASPCAAAPPPPAASE